jgi:hypothetical protein
MLVINPPVSIYLQCASFCFLCAGQFADLLVVRFCLFGAYSCLFANAIMGSPLFPYWRRPGHVSLDLLGWCCCCLYTYASSIINLLNDERPVPIGAEEDALWRMLYRLGGITRKVFAHEVLPEMEVVHFKAGVELPVDTHFHILYRGLVRLQVVEGGQVIHEATDSSGCIFDFKQLGLIPDDKHVRHHVVRVTTASDAILFQFTNTAIRDIANRDNIRNVWQTVFIGVLVRVAMSRFPGKSGVRSTAHDPTYIDPLFRPLDRSEEPPPYLAGSGRALERPLAHVMYYVGRTFTPPWPFGRHRVGFRHRLPVPRPSYESANVESRFSNGDESLELMATAGGSDSSSPRDKTTYGSVV